MKLPSSLLVPILVAVLTSASLVADITRDGTTVFSRDTGIHSPSGDFTAMVTFRHRGYAPVPKEAAWRNGMVMCFRSGYYEGWRVFLHDNAEMRPVFEIGRKEGAVALDGGFPVSMDVWHRLAVSWRHGDSPDVGAMRLWLDGRLLAESPPDRPAPLVDDSTLKLGYVDFGVGALHLEAKDPVVVPMALDNEEVKADFDRCADAAHPDPRMSHPLLMQVLDRAMARVRLDDAAQSGGIRAGRKAVKVVDLGPGRQAVRETRFFEGDASDGLVIRGAADGSTVLDGAENIPASAFRSLEDPALLARVPERVRRKVVCAEMKGLDALRSFGVGVPHRDGPLLFTTDGRPLVHARWPDAGCLAATNLAGAIRFAEPAPRLPAGTKFLAYGYWKYLWADAALPAEMAADGSFRLLEAHGYGLSDAPFAAIIGVPEAMDGPGEWCAVGDTLLLVPPVGFSGVRVPRFGGPFFEFRNVRGVRLQNVTLRGATGTALKAQGCEGITLENVGVSAVGGDGMTLGGCDGALVLGCRFSDTGHNALTISGGDRGTLRPGNMRVENCAFERTGRLMRTYTPGILLEGCGGVVSKCVFQELPSSAIRVEGNDHLVRDSVFRRTVLESDDQGVIDIWGDPAYRGNVYFRNRFSQVGGEGNHPCGRAAIRFDDMISGQAVVSNEFDDCSRGNFGAVQMNGGCYNAVVGNLFKNCARGVTIGRWDDARWTRTLAEPEVAGKFRLARENDAYFRRYPELYRLGRDHGVELLLGNRFENTPEPVKGLSAGGFAEL